MCWLFKNKSEIKYKLVHKPCVICVDGIVIDPYTEEYLQCSNCFGTGKVITTKLITKNKK